MKKYLMPLCLLLACALLAGCAKPADSSETTTAAAETTVTTTAISVTVTEAPVTTDAPEPEEAAIASTALFIDDPDEDRVPGLDWTFEDYGKNGIGLVPIPDEPGTYVMSNVVILCFTRAASNEEQDEFIKSRSDIFEGIIGRQSGNNTITVKLRTPLTERDVLTESEYMNEVYPQLDSLKELSPIVINAFANKYYRVSLDGSGTEENNIPDTGEEPPEAADTANYEDGGHYYSGFYGIEDYEKNGYPVTAVYEPPFTAENPSFWFPSNVISVFFRNSATSKEIDEFIAEHSDVFEKNLGGNNTVNMRDIKLVKPLTDKKSMTYDEYYTEVYEDLSQFAELSPLVTDVYISKIHRYHDDAAKPE